MLEAAAEAYLTAKVPSIPTLSRLQDLEEFYGLEHAIPRRPFPPHRKLPLRRVWFEDRMKSSSSSSRKFLTYLWAERAKAPIVGDFCWCCKVFW